MVCRKKRGPETNHSTVVICKFRQQPYYISATLYIISADSSADIRCFNHYIYESSLYYNIVERLLLMRTIILCSPFDIIIIIIIVMSLWCFVFRRRIAYDRLIVLYIHYRHAVLYIWFALVLFSHIDDRHEQSASCFVSMIIRLSSLHPFCREENIYNKSYI